MKSVMIHNFQQVPKVQIPRSVFDLSHGHKTTLKAGVLAPVFLAEVLPGDTFHVNGSIAMQMLSSLKVPVMDNIVLESFFFFVPNRLVWDNWQKFCGEEKIPIQDYDDPEEYTEVTVPMYEFPAYSGVYTHDISNYMGIPSEILGSAASWYANCLPFRAYWLIWNEWFRDENIVDPVTIPTGDGPDDSTDYGLACAYRMKRPDYFTSCLPWPQKGPTVTIPLGESADVWGDGTTLGLYNVAGGTTRYGGLWPNSAPGFPVLRANGDTIDDPVGTLDSSSSVNLADDYSAGVVLKTSGHKSGLYADLSDATAYTINALREAFQLQKMYERDARGGTRYTEIVRSHFGVISPDARLQRPEYLGGGRQSINQHTVHQTVPGTQTDQVDALGVRAAYVTSGGSGHGFVKSFTEHGHVIGILNIRADVTYQRHFNRMWFRQTRFDYPWPSLAHLGEQEVYNKEIFFDPADVGQDNVFGYQERYAEWRYMPSRISGMLASHTAYPLDIFHLAQNIQIQPTLSPQFMAEYPPIARIKALEVLDYQNADFIVDMYWAFKAVRPLPVYGVPGLIDHF